MSEAENFRFDRISKLLKELEYECSRGFMEGDLDESLGFQFIVPVSRQLKGGVVVGRFETTPMHRDSMYFRPGDLEPRLRVVK